MRTTLDGFDPGRDRIPESELLPLDRYMLARTRDLTEKIRGWYDAFEFHRVYQAVNEFAIVDLSSFYLDVLKDRLYRLVPAVARAIGSDAKGYASLILYATAVVLAFVQPWIAFGIYAGVALMWFVPDRRFTTRVT